MDHYRQQAPYFTQFTSNARGPRAGGGTAGGDGASIGSADSTYGGSGVGDAPAAPGSATHDISRVSYHVRNLDTFVKSLEDSATRAFPNRGRPLQRYTKVQALFLHWKSDDLFVLPELEDLEQCMREDYNYQTDIFAIPSENPHLELMLKVASFIKDHESPDTLFIVYYGGHARIDESRQSTWCATRHSGSPWLQWSAIQTLLERSISDALILLDCCAGAASATFPNGKSITETISASSWDAIAPDPGRYSFTNALIEVMQQWRLRAYSAAMLHAEVLARLKHPRPVTINGKHFEARSTPVHFMMTSNHRAPSIELGRLFPDSRRPSGFEDASASSLPGPAGLPQIMPAMATGGHHMPSSALVPAPQAIMAGGRGPVEETSTEPNEDTPHVMISLALEDDQRLDLSAWEQWLSSFPALAKYVKVQGVFKSHSTLLLLSLPVMIWDLLPEDHACSFVAFIRSNNLIKNGSTREPEVEATVAVRQDHDVRTLNDEGSIFSGTTYSPGVEDGAAMREAPRPQSRVVGNAQVGSAGQRPSPSLQRMESVSSLQTSAGAQGNRAVAAGSDERVDDDSRRTGAANQVQSWDGNVRRTPIMNQVRTSRRTAFLPEDDVPEGPALAAHVVTRLEEYYQNNPEPNVAVTEFLASNLGVSTRDVNVWFHHRHQQQRMTLNLQNLRIDDLPPPQFGRDEVAGGGVAFGGAPGPRMILPGHLNRLLEICSSSQQVLLIDLRAPSLFERSHIHGAANLRAPLDFILYSTFEMVESAFKDEGSRHAFSKWYSSRCVVFYDRVVEFPWECPTAGAMLDRFRRKGWSGQGFILKGHYKEFSASYDTYIVGKNGELSEQATPPPPTADETRRANEQYSEWLSLVENEDRVPSTTLNPSKQRERVMAMEENQRDLESEFQSRFPALYKKYLALKPSPPSDEPPPPHPGPAGEKGKRIDTLVEPLSRGLEKMQEAGMAAGHSHSHSPPPPPMSAPPVLGGKSAGYHHMDKMGGGETPPAAEGYDEIDPLDEQLANDPAFRSAGGSDHRPLGPPGGFGRGPGGGVDTAAADPARQRGRQPSIWKRIRSGGGK